ncbi:MAG: polysaccharide deacetylase family protein [Polyangiaceae bacterium]|nr:polysaccharide deacetylase family protein [Polyangiaceae bacterium]
MSLRSKLARVLDGLGVVQAALQLRSFVATPWLTTLCYHRTAEQATSGDDLDGEIIDATPAQFDQQMKFLSEHFNFVGVDEVVDFVEGRGKLPMNPVLVTFDDGYKECFTLSLPILKRYGARGTFFISTQHMTERRMFWWDRFNWIVRHTTTDQIRLVYPRELVLDVADEQQKRRTHQTLTTLVKQTVGLNLDRFMEELETAAGCSLPRDEERKMVDRALMSWAEVEHLSSAGMSVGSHSFSHRVLQTVEPKDLDVELGGSRRELEERLGRAIRTIAYPVGYPLGTNETVRRAVRDAGYSLGFTVRAGVFGGKRFDTLDVPRILMDTSYDLQHFSAMTTLPPLAPRSEVDFTRR